MTFTDIIGHDRPLNIIRRAIANGTLAHAYLFSGDEGIGKRMTALALAAAVNCHDPGPEGGCGACPSCRKVASFSHPDVYMVVPDGSEIKIDQIRQVQADLALRPFEGRKKALIVDGAESMKDASANAFLKTLEEPPGDALIILITPMPQGLLQTIRSRCQEIKFHPLPRRTLEDILARKRGPSEGDARLIAALSRGSLGRGLEMDVEQEKAARDEALTLWSMLGRMSPDQILAQAEAFSKDRERFERLLDFGVEWLRDVMVYRETRDEGLLVHAGQVDAIKQWSEALPLSRIFSDMELFGASRNLLDRRVSGQLVAENLFLKLGSA